MFCSYRAFIKSSNKLQKRNNIVLFCWTKSVYLFSGERDGWVSGSKRGVGWQETKEKIFDEFIPSFAIKSSNRTSSFHCKHARDYVPKRLVTRVNRKLVSMKGNVLLQAIGGKLNSLSITTNPFRYINTLTEKNLPVF